MARLPRLALAARVHHVLQRGIEGRPIFCDPQDFGRMRADLALVCREQHLALHAYVLMPDHFQLLLTPTEASGLSRGLQSLGRRYVAWFNRRYARAGPLWEGRYRSVLVDSQQYLLDCMRYIELYPLRAAFVTDAASYPWSSLPHHLGLTLDRSISDHPCFWALGNTPFERQAAYADCCALPLDPALVQRIRAATRRGGVLGDPLFVAGLAQQTGRRLERRSPGRPRRHPAAAAESPGSTPL